MKELVELYNLINKSDFRHKLWEISCSDSEIDFKTRRTLCGTSLSGKILFDSNHYIVYNYVGYDDVTVLRLNMVLKLEMRLLSIYLIYFQD